MGERLVSLGPDERGWRQLTLFWRDANGNWNQKAVRLTVQEWAHILTTFQREEQTHGQIEQG